MSKGTPIEYSDAAGNRGVAKTRRLRRKTRWSVYVGEYLSRWIITVGGVGTIAAILLVCIFLAWVVVPMFRPATVGETRRLSLAEALASPEGAESEGSGETSHSPSLPFVRTNEYVSAGWMLTETGRLCEFRVDTGELLDARELTGGKRLTAFDYLSGGTAVFGFADGTIALGKIEFVSEFLNEPPPELADLGIGELGVYANAIVERTPEDQFRIERLEAAIDEPVKLCDRPVRLLRLSEQTSGLRIAAVAEDGNLYVRSVRKKKNLLTGKETVTLTGGEIALEADAQAGPPDFLLLSGLGDNVYVIWEDGTLFRFNVRSVKELEKVETIDVLPAAAKRITVAEFLLGKTTLLIGDDAGGIAGWFCIKPDEATTSDGARLVRAHVFSRGPGAVSAIASSARQRMFVAAYADGTRRLYHATAEQLVAEIPGHDEDVRSVAVTPKDDALLAVAGDTLLLTPVDAPHPGVTWKTIFGRVWYEGYNAPEFVWQSSSGTDDFEPKYSLVPLIFGTLKATFYTMLLAVPLALAAAVYSSEFLDRRVKQRVKPVIELMAGLPSVVLGFLAALVLAPVVAKIIPQTLAFLILLPWFFLSAGYLWQLLPRHWTVRFSSMRIWAAIPIVAAAVVASIYAGTWCEQIFFAGDVMEWLNNRQGSATGGWAYICLPAAALLTAIVVARFVNEPLRRATRGASRTAVAAIELGKFLIATLAALGIGWAMGWVLTTLGWDPRDSLMGTYIQRNALVVGIAMAFAVIPIIYTIADDALSAVPDHLRAASLGAGATPWQTAVRIVIPTAAGGLFSAVMIGLGRAVGETMIVLMAAGNTPIMEWNVFNGFRTLSANIAVELPEAVQNGTHYRMLFLAALMLFVMTFVINTAAEIVRLRFRKKAVQL
ncbi:hypothetical protein JCM19992_03110 [Thermostilla marina]